MTDPLTNSPYLDRPCRSLATVLSERSKVLSERSIHEDLTNFDANTIAHLVGAYKACLDSAARYLESGNYDMLRWVLYKQAPTFTRTANKGTFK